MSIETFLLFFIYGVLFVIGLIVAICFVHEVLFFSFLFSEYSIKSIYRPGEYPPASIWIYTKNFWTELWYVLKKYYAWPIKFLNISLNTTSNSNTAILLVHGYCRNQTDWLWMRKQLQSTQCPIFCVNLRPNLAGIDEIAQHSLPKKIASILQQTKCRKIILIGHSMGGLASTYYSTHLDQDKVVSAVITIGSPLYGTKVSVFGKGKNAQQMCPGSEFLTDLLTKLHTQAFNNYQICSKFDNLIFPWQSALFEHAPTTRQLVLPFTSHLGLLYSYEVANQLKAWIKELN